MINQSKFHEKWHQSLISNPRSGIDIELARSHRSQREVLVIDATTPDASQDAGSIRMVNLFSILNDLNCKVTFFADNRAWVEGASDKLQQMGVEVWYAPYLKSPEEFLQTHGRRFETIIVSRYYIAENYLRLIEKHAPHAKLVFDTVDLHFLRELRQAELKQDEQIHAQAELTRQKELAVASRSDLTLVVSPFEKDYLAQIDPALNVEIVATIVDVIGNRTPWSERADIMFVGGYQHPPNVDAVIYFVNEVFPLVRQKLPEVQFHIIGSKAPPEVTRLQQDGVIYHGYVADLEPFLDNVRVAVAPLRFGAGVKGKINTSMSYGQPVVATSVGIEGMYSEDGLNVLVGDTPETFGGSRLPTLQQ